MVSPDPPTSVIVVKDEKKKFLELIHMVCSQLGDASLNILDLLGRPAWHDKDIQGVTSKNK